MTKYRKVLIESSVTSFLSYSVYPMVSSILAPNIIYKPSCYLFKKWHFNLF